MKLTKLLEIKSELDRFTKRLNDAIEVAQKDEEGYYDESKSKFIADGSNKPNEFKRCVGCKQSAALKRSSTDLKMALYSLGKD